MQYARVKQVIKQLAGALTMAIGLVNMPLAAEDAGADMVIHASGFPNDKGQAVAGMFLEGEDILGKPHFRVVGDIKQGQARLSIPHIKYGSYAVRVFHDENGNNTLDHNMLRLPAEPLGFSNGFKLGLFSGFPTFEKLRFSFQADSPPLNIVVK